MFEDESLLDWFNSPDRIATLERKGNVWVVFLHDYRNSHEADGDGYTVEEAFEDAITIFNRTMCGGI